MIKKAVRKRIKITGTGKMLRRKMGASHFRVKKTSAQKQAKRRTSVVKKADVKPILEYLQGRA